MAEKEKDKDKEKKDKKDKPVSLPQPGCWCNGRPGTDNALGLCGAVMESPKPHGRVLPPPPPGSSCVSGAVF